MLGVCSHVKCAFMFFFGKSPWLVASSQVSLSQHPAREEGAEVENWVLFSTQTNAGSQKCLVAAWQSSIEVSRNLGT